MRSILIADDESSLRMLVAATLEADGYELLEAADGEQAWLLINERHPELVILDWNMPRRTGLELAAIIRGDPILEHTRVIMLTSNAQRAQVEAGLAAGADRYLTKPFSPIELVDAVEQVLVEQ